jgi:hypothetical protein
MENKNAFTEDELSEAQQIPESIPMGSFTAWYVLLIVVLIVEIIFFSWLTKTFA